MKLELIISIASCITAVCAVAISVWSAYQTRKHNQLSVKPVLQIGYHFGGSKEYYGISIINNGFGPALLNKCKIYFNSHEIESEDEIDVWEIILNVASPKLLSELRYQTISNSVLSPNERTWLISMSKENHLATAELFEILEQVSIEMSYTCVYGREFRI